MTALSFFIGRATGSGGRVAARSSAAVAVSAIALADSPCASFEERLASRPTPGGARRRSGRQRQPRPALGDDLGDERAEAAVTVVRLDGDGERDAASDARRAPRPAPGSGRPRRRAARSPALRLRAARRPRPASCAIEPVGDDRDVAPVADLLDARRARSARRGPAPAALVLAEPEVDRARRRLGSSHAAPARACVGVRGREDGHPGLRAHDARRPRARSG